MRVGRNGSQVSGRASRRTGSRWFVLGSKTPDWVVSLVAGLVIWELGIRVFQPSTLFLSAPSEIAADLWNIVASGFLWRHFSISLRGLLAGLFLAIGVGVPFGIMLGLSRTFRRYIEPWVNGLYSTPAIALAPLFVLWLGFGVAKTIGVVFLLAVFPIVMNTMDGVLRVDRQLRDVALAFGADRRETILRVLLPGSTGYVLTGIRLAVGRGVVGVVVADLFGASAGLGFMILEAARVFNAARIFSGTLILAAIGVVLSAGVRLVERHWAGWLDG